MLSYKNCKLCPRNCSVDRSVGTGFCGCSDKLKIARAALHYWEEPCISGKEGSGAVFFSGCTLRCCYCQNDAISRDCFGKEISIERLAQIFLELQEKGANNINLVTATQWLPSVTAALDTVRGRLRIPVVFNCGGYEKIETVMALKDYIDIFLPDLKYYNSDYSKAFSKAPDYYETAIKAIGEMIKLTGKPQFDERGLLKKGVIIRHLVLPGLRKDSINLLHSLHESFENGSYLISIMSQFTPTENSRKTCGFDRRITKFEYNSVIEDANKLGIVNGYMQDKSSAKEEYTPPFDLQGV